MNVDKNKWFNFNISRLNNSNLQEKLTIYKDQLSTIMNWAKPSFDIPVAKRNQLKWRLRNHRTTSMFLEAIIDWLPIVWIPKWLITFHNSLKTEYWKIERYRLAALIWCAPAEIMTMVSASEEDVIAGILYYFSAKIIYRSFYSKYLLKSRDMTLKEFVEKLKTDFRFFVIINMEFNKIINEDPEYKQLTEYIYKLLKVE